MDYPVGSSQWVPFSSVAYGANAVYVPRWGEPGAIECILVMYQNFPTYKTHPALDIFHRYIVGAERFQQNHEFRVLGWQIDLERRCWSFLYLPTERDDIRVLATFTANEQGRLRMDLQMDNPSDEDREWELHLYCAPCAGIDLPEYQLRQLDARTCAFRLAGVEMELASDDLSFIEMHETDSAFWINFPANAEVSNDPDNPTVRHKHRLRLSTFPVTVLAGTQRSASIDLFTGMESKAADRPHPVAFAEPSTEVLPYQHEWWETLHNQQYTHAFRHGGMTNRMIPARQWSRFFFWDVGMTAVGAVEMDPAVAEAIIAEMPDPARCGDEVFSYGSYIVTALYALWELYQLTGDPRLLAKHYPLMQRLVMAMYGYPALTPGPEHDGILRSRRNCNGADDYPAIVYADGWPFAWDYQQTLPLNPDRTFKHLQQVGLTAHAVRHLKLLRLIAHVLNQLEDIPEYDRLITASETAINAHYWHEGDGCFYNRVDGEEGFFRSRGLYECLPLLSGSVDAARQERLLASVLSPQQFWTPYGVTVVAQDNPCYRRDGYWNGAIWIPPQWFFWKAFYNLGVMDAATRLADNVLALWEMNHTQTLCCWEKFQVHDGHGAGNSRFSGLSTPVLALWRARRTPGRVQVGQEALITTEVDLPTGILQARITTPFYAGRMGMSAVLTPACPYRITANGTEIAQVLSDMHGYLAWSFDIARGESALIDVKPLGR
jgi:hypothetical protein